MKLVCNNYNLLFTGYSDPSKDLRKAVKAKEKAAKKAKKEKKKKGEKAEDLFDPENLAKYRKEIEEKRKLASALSPGEIRISRVFFNTASIFFAGFFIIEEMRHITADKFFAGFLYIRKSSKKRTFECRFHFGCMGFILSAGR